MKNLSEWIKSHTHNGANSARLHLTQINGLTLESLKTKDHHLLDGLADDDHLQYYNALRHTKAIHDLLGINADTLDGFHAVDFAVSGHTHDHSALTNVTADQHHARLHSIGSVSDHNFNSDLDIGNYNFIGDDAQLEDDTLSPTLLTRIRREGLAEVAWEETTRTTGLFTKAEYHSDAGLTKVLASLEVTYT